MAAKMVYLNEATAAFVTPGSFKRKQICGCTSQGITGAFNPGELEDSGQRVGSEIPP